MFPAKEPGIDRPRSRTDEGESQPQGCQEKADPRITLVCDTDGKFRERNDDPCDRGPQADEQEEAGGGRDYLRRRRWLAQVRDGRMNESGSDHNSLSEKPGARPAMSKCRK